MTEKSTLRSDFLSCCSFCGYEAKERKTLIIGPGVSICDNCTTCAFELCVEQGSIQRNLIVFERPPNEEL
jgi:ATP-dependent protease Clp ATPase subunit